jgi:putative PIN family toxin of toxin-antitoxin system
VKVFLDTNVLVSAFATRGLSADLFEMVLLEHELVTGHRVLQELENVLRRKIRLPAARCAEIVEFLRAEAARVVEDAPEAHCGAEPADRAILGEALAGEAQAFVTGDAALVALGEISGMPILTPRRFWELLRGIE